MFTDEVIDLFLLLSVPCTVILNSKYRECEQKTYIVKELGVDRLSAPILSILPIIDIGHFKNRFADNFYFFMQTIILFTGDIIIGE